MTVEQVDAQFKLMEQIHNLRAEVERLRSIAFGAEEDARMLRAEMAQAEQNWAADWKHEFDNLRNETIEKCARVAEIVAKGQWNTEFKDALERTAAAIRALKDKP